MKKRINWMAAAVLTLLWLSPVAAKVRAELDRNVINEGETVMLTVHTDDRTAAQPDFSELADVFDILSTGHSLVTQIINGRMSVDNSYTAELLPRSTGEQVIPPIKVGNEYTQTLKMTVRKADPKSTPKGDIFLETELEKPSVYVQEQNTLTVRLYFARKLLDGQLSEPNVDGLIVQKLGADKNYQSTRDGRIYQVIERRYALFPEKSGTVEIGPLVLTGRVAEPQRDPYSFFQTGRRLRVFSKPVTMEVKTIPPEFRGKPWLPAKKVEFADSWTGLDEIKVGEPVTRVVELTAVGLNETQLPDLKFPESQDVRVYAEPADTETWTDGENVIAKKRWKLALIPMRAGEVTIPQLSLDWFNTQTRQKATAVLPGKKLSVAPSAAGNVAAPPPVPPLPGDKKQKPAATVNSLPPSPATGDQNPAAVASSTDGGSNRYWYWAALVFGIGWLITIVALISKGSRPVKKPHTPPQASGESIAQRKTELDRAINGGQASDIQKALIRWWNARWPGHKVTNTGQIIAQLASPQAQSLVIGLEKAIYAPDNNTTVDATAWHKALKQGLFTPKKDQKNTDKNTLPPLYD